MGETGEGAPGPASGWPAWIRFTLLVAVAIGVGIAVWAFATDSSRTRSGDMGAVRELSIVASNFESWPESAHQVAQTNLFHRPDSRASDGTARVSLFHPELGAFAVEYRAVPEAAAGEAEEAGGDGPCVPRGALRCVDIVDGRMTVRGEAIGDRDSADPFHARRLQQQLVVAPGAVPPVQYAVRNIPLERVLSLPPTFEHVLIVEGSPSGETSDDRLPGLKVVAQIGKPGLPIRSLNELPKLRDQTLDLAGLASAILPGDGGSGSAAQLSQLLSQNSRDALVPVDSRISGRAYRLYLYPVSLAGTGKPIDFYVVGVKPDEAGLFDVDLSGAPALAFGFALAILLALSPIIKLAFLGPVDGLRRLELFAIIAGCLVAAAMASGSVVLAFDVMEGGARAAARMAVQARALAKEMHAEIRQQVTQPMPAPAELLLPDARYTNERGRIILDATRPGRDFPQPNTMFILDGQGRQALDTPIISFRDQPGADWAVADRGYFQRALLGERDPGSEALVPLALSGRCRTVRGFAVDQVRSRPDGVAKTVMAAPLLPDSEAAYAALTSANPTLGEACRAAQAQASGSGRVWATSFVMRSMLRPDVAPDSAYVVVDMLDTDLPVLFHSRPGRAHVEVLKSGLDGEARAGVAMLRAAPPGAEACLKGPTSAVVFRGRYNGMLRQFAAVPVPCTRWAVLSFVDLDDVDRAAAGAAKYATMLWLGLGFAAGALVGLAVMLRPQRGWRKWDWLWPSEGQGEGYRRLAMAGGGLALLGMGLALAGLGMPACLVAAVGVGWILWQLSRPHRPVPEPLGDATAHNFRALMIVVLLLMAVVPVLGLASDARVHLDGVAAAERQSASVVAAAERRLAEERILRVFREQWRDRPLPPRTDTKPVRMHVEPASPFSLTAAVRRMVYDLPAPERVAPAPATRAPLPVPWLVGFVLMLGALAGLLVLAVRTIGRALFGFGVALEAVEHPRFEAYPDLLPQKVMISKVRTNFMAIGAPTWVRASLKEEAGEHVFDLFDLATDSEAAGKLKLPPAASPPNLLLLHDFELLLRNPKARSDALVLIERMLEEQKKQPEGKRCRIGLIADMSPLDRFLQSSEHREATDADALSERWKSGEDIRWSRILERFTNYVYRAVPRPVPEDADLAAQPAGIRLVVEELAYLPDDVVEAIIPDMTPGLTVAEIIRWAKDKRLQDRSDAAVVDYLASQLIEHYHYIWSVSSRAEQILIYRFAHGQIVNISEAYALRSLVRRGIVVLDPVPRIVNRSFAQFVRHVEEPKRLAIWQASQPDGLWTRLKAPLTFVLPLTIALLVLVLSEGAGNLATTIPFMLAAGPALLNLLGGVRRTFG